jgi:hypothetical protein
LSSNVNIQVAGLSDTRAPVTYKSAGAVVDVYTAAGLSPSFHIQEAGLSATRAPVTYQVLVLLLMSLLLLV